MPALRITENGERVRLDLGGFAQGEGASCKRRRTTSFAPSFAS